MESSPVVHLQLTKHGILPDPWPGVPEENQDEQPARAADLLRFWYHTLVGIDTAYTLGDLLAVLRNLEDPDELSPILGCDVGAFLTDAARPPQRPPNERIRFLQVSSVTELTSYVPDASNPDEPSRGMDDDEAAGQDRIDAGIAELTGESAPRKVVDATGDDPIMGKPARRRMQVGGHHGRWAPPYELSREFSGHGDQPAEAFALDFIPLSSLVQFPLRYDPRIRFYSEWPMDGHMLFETELTVTFGEFLQAIFREIGFHGSPDMRDEAWEMLKKRFESLDLEKS